MSDMTRRGLLAMVTAVAVAPITKITTAKSGPPPEFEPFLKRCVIVPRGDDGPLFFADEKTIQVRLDRYVIIPMERYGEDLT